MAADLPIDIQYNKLTGAVLGAMFRQSWEGADARGMSPQVSRPPHMTWGGAFAGLAPPLCAAAVRRA